MGLEYLLIPFKGTYYKLTTDANHRVRSSIYPVPNPSLPFLGVHFTRSISGDVYIGPTIIPALGRENYSFLQNINISESLNIMSHMFSLYSRNTQGFRSLVGLAATHLTKAGVFRSARSLMSDLDAASVVKSAKIGIRPQLLNTQNMTLEMDFLIEHGRNSVHVLNSISPAFTSSFAVAKHLASEAVPH